jgi:hypothetical protein
MLRGNTGRFETIQVTFNVLADGRRQVLRGARFGWREQPGLHFLCFPSQLGENVFGRGLVPASSRDFDDHAVAVSVARDVGARLVADALGPVLPGDDRCRLRLLVRVTPSSDPYPLPSDNLGVRR